MSAALSISDRARITAALWRLDVLMWDLPRRARRANLAELRANLTAAAADLGARAAVRQLGDLRSVADDYLDAEYGDVRRRPRWRTGMYWALCLDAVMFTAGLIGFLSFMDGVLAAAGPGTNGTYQLPGYINAFGFTGEISVDGGEFGGFVFGASLWILILPLAVFLVGSRAWRALPALRRNRRAS
jgi:hypothetical protein